MTEGSSGSRWPSMAVQITIGAATMTGVADMGLAVVKGVEEGGGLAVDLVIAAAGHAIAVAGLVIVTAGLVIREVLLVIRKAPLAKRKALPVTRAAGPGPSRRSRIMGNLVDAAIASREAAHENKSAY